MAQIPPREVSSNDKEKLRALDLDLKKVVFGQDRALNQLAAAIKLARAGLRSPEKPIGTVWVAIDVAGDVHAVRAVLPGDRNEIRYRGAQLALDRLRRAFTNDVESAAWMTRA